MTLLSLAHLTVLDAHPVELIEAAAAGGFDAAGLRIVPPLPGDAIVPVVGNLALIREVKARMAHLGVRIWDVEAIWLVPQTDVGALLPALDLAVELGARYVLTVGHDPDRGRLRANLSQLGEACRARGLRLMLEFIPYAAVGTLAAAHALLQEASLPDAGILVDALHLSRSGGSPAELGRYDPGLFPYVHLCDAPGTPPPADGLRAEARGGRSFPGEGGLDLRAFLAGFPPGTPLAVEAPSVPHAALPPIERARRAGATVRRLLAG